MRKAQALEMLGGTVASAAEAVQVTYQAVNQWPDPLPRRIEDRVLAAYARKHLLRQADLPLGDVCLGGKGVAHVA